MTENLNGKQVLALLAQDEVPEIEFFDPRSAKWSMFEPAGWTISEMLRPLWKFRIKPTPARRLSVTLSNGEVVSWPEPVQRAPEIGQEYFLVQLTCDPLRQEFENQPIEATWISTGNVHLTREAAQEHADALRRINTPIGGVV